MRLLALAWLLCWPLGAARGASVPVHLISQGTCPSAAGLAAALSAALPGARLVPPGSDPSSLAVEVEDRGDRYRVAVKGSVREFVDAHRSCEERARAAAVFIALVLEPPWISLPEPPAPPALPPGRPSPPVRPPPRLPGGPFVDLEAGADLALVPRGGRAENSPLTGGGALRLGLTWRASGFLSGLSVGAGGLAPVTLVFVQASARLWRVPLDLSARVGLRRGRVELLAEPGLLLSVLRVAGLGPEQDAQAPPATRLEAALRLGLSLRAWVHPRVAPGLTLWGAVVPRPYDLVLEPAGAVGQTPRFWLGATLGLAIRLR